ncbi:uncharacterized protein LOC133744909 [Rosa rugosa]|uniref:uncharacterized protein LOC133744909 n=1 Tax=Rosa rugosa TaxID=74645 RepID=UPI002B4135F9|nr:uncharacterized protein LOC133744909 [Rosa rugosa]
MNNLTLYCAFAASAAGAILNLFRKKYTFNTPTGLMALLLYTPPHNEKTRVSLLMAVAASVGAEFSLYFIVFITSADLTSRVTHIPVLYIGIITLAYACMSIFVLCRGACDMVAKRREDLFNALVIQMIMNFVDSMVGKKNLKIKEESSYLVASIVC